MEDCFYKKWEKRKTKGGVGLGQGDKGGEPILALSTLQNKEGFPGHKDWVD